MAGGLFVGMDSVVMQQLDQVTQGQQAIYISGLSLLANSCIVLFITFRGYQTVAGKLQTPAVDVAWELSKMAIIWMFVSNIDVYLDSAITAINGMKDGFSGDVSVWALLDTLWEKTQALGDELYNLGDSDFVNIRGTMGMAFVWAGSIIIMIMALIVFMSAQIVMLLMTVVAPIFIFCLMFGFLRQMFNNWLQIIFSSLLTFLFASLVIRVGMSYIDDKLAKALAVSGASNVVSLGAQVFLAGVGCALLIWIASKIASQVAGVGVEGAIQGMAAVGLGAAGFGAMKAARGAAGSIGGRAQENLSSNREKPAAASGASTSGEQMKRRTQAVTQRMRSQAGHYK